MEVGNVSATHNYTFKTTKVIAVNDPEEGDTEHRVSQTVTEVEVYTKNGDRETHTSTSKIDYKV